MSDKATYLLWALATVVCGIYLKTRVPDLDLVPLALLAGGASALPVALLAYAWPGKKKRTSA